MTAVLVDTDVFSFLFKGDSRATDYAAFMEGNVVVLSFMTVAELFQWAYERSWGAARIERLEQAFARYVIVPVDNDLCRLWARIRADRRAKGRPLAPQDAWIAATAVRHGLVLVSHNVRDFAGIDGLVLRGADTG